MCRNSFSCCFPPSKTTEVLHVVAQSVADDALDSVHALACQLDDLITLIVNVVDVVAVSANHGVSACYAVEDVVAVVADDTIIQGVAGAVNIQAFKQAQFFDTLVEQIVGAADHGVVTRACAFQNAVVDAVDDVYSERSFFRFYSWSK